MTFLPFLPLSLRLSTPPFALTLRLSRLVLQDGTNLEKKIKNHLTKNKTYGIIKPR